LNQSVRIEPFTASPTIQIDRSVIERSDDQCASIDSAWQKLCDQNPRYFNGGILSFTGFDPSSSTVSAAVEQYKNHAVRDAIGLSIKLLAVTGVLAAHDAYGQPMYLICKRSPSTHGYGNLWEFGPCGGVDVPPASNNTLDFNAIVSELNREAMEEAGIDLSGTLSAPLVLAHDEAAGSVDIVIRVELPKIPQMEPSWEYVDHVWISLDDLKGWIESNPDQFIPTAVAIAQILDAQTDYD